MSDSIRIRPGARLCGSTSVPGDKSISHRALILGALAEGTTRVRGFLAGGDTLVTLGCVRGLGVPVDCQGDALTVDGPGMFGLTPPEAPLDCVNAGTAIRLLAGVLAGQSFPSALDGSEQLRRRPMVRVTDPLIAMGAQVTARDGRAPLGFAASNLRGIRYTLPVPSAQVKSCVLLAGLHADSPTTVIEPGPARDHTERMLRAMGATVCVEGNAVTVEPGTALRPLDMTIPGDISSAAFLLVAGRIAGDGPLTVRGVGINPTRTGLLDILAAMGVEVVLERLRDEGGEPVADLVIMPGLLTGAEIGGDLIVRAIDEFPALMIAATQAEGETVVCDAAELRVKETDRIAVMTSELAKMGAEIEERADGFRVVGPQRLHGAVVDGHDDHRVAMALAAAGLVASGETVVQGASCMADSFPGFVETLVGLGAEIEVVLDD